MRRAPTVLLILLAIFGSTIPPTGAAQAGGEGGAGAKGFRLEQNFPNPLVDETWIPFSLDESLFEGRQPRLVTIQIFNVLNQLVAVPRAPEHPRGKNLSFVNLPYSEAGRKLAYWDGKDSAGRRVPSGVYYCQLAVNDQRPLMMKIIVVHPSRRSKIPIPWFGKQRNRSE